VVNNKIKRVPLENVAGKLKVVEPDSQIIKQAKFVGISFGD
jgi:6-phosphofructokinase 1